MNKNEFIMGVEALEKYFERKYEKETKLAIVADIFHKLKPTAEEWADTIALLRQNVEYLPRIKIIREYLFFVRKEADLKKAPKAIVQCPNCNPFNTLKNVAGFLLYIHDDGHESVLYCNCENVPDSAPEQLRLKYFFDNDLLDVNRVCDMRRRPILQPFDEWRKEKWEAVVNLYLNDKWVPKFLKKRFDEGNFERPKSFPKTFGGSVEIGDCPF